MTKRTLSLLLAAIMLSLCMLSACGGVEEKLPDPDLSLNDQPKNEITVTAAESSHKKYGEVELFVLDGLTTSSPDGGITAYFWQDAQRRIYYSVTAGKEEVIEPSLLGLTMINADLSAGIESITSYDRADVVKAEYETCLTVSQKDVSCLDYCMQREIHLKKGEAGMTILVRVYNDGFAYRYTDVTTGRKDKETVISEASQIVLPKDTVTFAGGYSAVKLYFMLGLPTETDEDVLGIAEVASHVMHAWRESASNKNRGVRITVSTSWFVPKAHTAFQWEPQIPKEEYERRVKLLRENMLTKSVTYNWHDSDTSYMEAVISRGDRRLCRVIETAWRKGEHLSAWEEYFSLDRWLEAFEECGLDPHFYANRKREKDELMPWAMISSGVTEQYLWREHERCYQSVTTPDCRTHCNGCGANLLLGRPCDG